MSETSHLFTNDQGERLTFVTSGCKFCGRVSRLIRTYGGEVVEEAGPHTVVLAPESSARQHKPSTARTLNTFSYLYVLNCVKRKELLPLKDYWVHRDPTHDDGVDLNTIMLGYFTWDGQLVRQPPKQQPSSTTASREDAGKPQEPPVKNCSVVLENIMLRGAAKGTNTSSQTKRPRRDDSRAAASRDAEEENSSNYSTNLHRDEGGEERGPASSMSTSYRPSLRHRVQDESTEEPLALTLDEEHRMMEEEEEEVQRLVTDDDDEETDVELPSLAAGDASDSRATRRHPRQNNKVRAAAARRQRDGTISEASMVIFNMGNLSGEDRTSHSDRKPRSHPRSSNSRLTTHQTYNVANSSSESRPSSDGELRIRNPSGRDRTSEHLDRKLRKVHPRRRNGRLTDHQTDNVANCSTESWPSSDRELRIRTSEHSDRNLRKAQRGRNGRLADHKTDNVANTSSESQVTKEEVRIRNANGLDRASAHSGRKAHPRRRNGRLTNHQTESVASDSDSSSSESQHASEEELRIRKQKRRKRRRYHPAIEEDEEEEEEPVLRNIQPRVQLTPVANTKLSKEAESKRTRRECRVDAGSSSETRWEEKTPKIPHVYVGKRWMGSDPAKDRGRQTTTERQTRAASSHPGPSGNPAPSASRGSWMSLPTVSTSSETSSQNNCPLFKSPSAPVAERQPPKQQPSSTTASREDAGKPQESPVKNCSVVLENIMLRGAAKGTNTSSISQTKPPRRYDSRAAASRDAEEENSSVYSTNLHRDEGGEERGPASSMPTSYRPSLRHRVQDESTEEPLTLTLDEEHRMMEEEEEEVQRLVTDDDDDEETDVELPSLAAGDASDSRATRRHPRQNNKVRAAAARRQRDGTISEASMVIFNMGNLSGQDRTSHSDRKPRSHPRSSNSRLTTHQTYNVANSSSESQPSSDGELRVRNPSGRDRTSERLDRKLRKVHPRRRNGRLTDHQTESVTIDSDSSSSESQHASEEELRIRKQKRRKRRRYHPAIEEDEEEEEEPVLRNIQPRVQLTPVANTKLSKEAESKRTRRECRVDAGSSSETRWEEITPKIPHVYVGKRWMGSNPAKDRGRQTTTDRQTRAASSHPGPSGNPAPSASRGSWMSLPTVSTSSETSSQNNCPLFKSPSAPVAERKGNYRIDEDVDILKYIISNQGHDLVGGRAFWQEMEGNMGHRRTWQSLKERYRMRILPNLMSYKRHGLDPSDLRQLGGTMEVAKKGLKKRMFRTEFTLDDDLLILKFISKNHRYGDVGGLLLWQEMENRCPMLASHPFSSLKTRFMKKILPNITAYNLTDDEVYQFQNRSRLREHQKEGEKKKQHVPRYTRRRVLPSERKSAAKTSTRHITKKAKHQDIMNTGSENSDKEESQSEDSTYALNTPLNHIDKLEKRIHKRALSQNETQELLQDRPAQRPDTDTHPTDTPQQSSQGPAKPQRKRLLVVDNVMELSPKTPFRYDSIDRTAIHRRKKELSEAHTDTATHTTKQRMKKQESEARITAIHTTVQRSKSQQSEAHESTTKQLSEAHKNTTTHTTLHRTKKESEAHKKQGPRGVMEEEEEEQEEDESSQDKPEVQRRKRQSEEHKNQGPRGVVEEEEDEQEEDESSQDKPEVQRRKRQSEEHKNQGSRGVVEESSQDEPREKMGKIVHEAEVHREMADEDSPQRVNTREKSPLTTSTLQEEMEEETENLQLPEVTPQKTMRENSSLTIPTPQKEKEQQTENLQLPEVTPQKTMREDSSLTIPTPQKEKEQETENLQLPEVTPQKTTREKSSLTIPTPQEEMEEQTENLQLLEEIIEETEEEREVMALENEAAVLEKLLNEKELSEEDEMSPGEEELEVHILNPADKTHIAGLEEKMGTQEGRVTHESHTPQGTHFSPVIPCLRLTYPHPKSPSAGESALTTHASTHTTPPPHHQGLAPPAPAPPPHQCSPSTPPPHLSPVPPLPHQHHSPLTAPLLSPATPLPHHSLIASPLHLSPSTPIPPHHSPAKVPLLSPSTPHPHHHTPATPPPPHLSPSTPPLHLSPSPPPPLHLSPSPTPPPQHHTPITPPALLPQHSKTSPTPLPTTPS
ncbi:uncharacterized protein LOC126986030 [Eriocheir sinensis]|uniref:uncharacterized protein LOC126986030 n=1 Tax=Eriocheir sinensis TaxID=95602 RepID=UPI0021C7B8A7|nr:uncharacterized protein LOC126986030 [Eriocheir sinensis]